MNIGLSILNTLDIPIYKQLYDQIAAQIVRGELTGNYCLPPIRTVAAELGISVITVKRAWDELEHSGFIATVAGKGCFVRCLTMEELKAKKERIAAEHFIKNSVLFKSLGLSLDELHNLIDEYYID